MLEMAEVTGTPVYIGGHRRRLVNSVQAARIAGIARSTLYLWVQLGKVEVARTAGGHLRIFADTLFQRDPRGRKPRRSASGV